MLKTKEKIKVIIADDHPLFRRGLKNAFSETSDIEVVAEAENGDDLLKKISGLVMPQQTDQQQFTMMQMEHFLLTMADGLVVETNLVHQWHISVIWMEIINPT